MRFYRSGLLLSWFYLLAIGTAAAQQPADSPTEDAPQKEEQATEAKRQELFLRVQRDEDEQPIALQVAIVRFALSDGGKKGASVDLVGAVHIAEKSYYGSLNRRFKD